MSSLKGHSNISETLAETIEPLQLKTYGRERVYLGIGDYQGGRLIVQISVYLSEIPNLIPVINRPLDSTHASKIKDYIIRRSQSGRAWILGSLTVNVDPADIHLFPIGSKLYIIRIPNATLLHITDGQHRIQAITELVASNKYRSLITNDQIPLSLVIEANISQNKLDFRDMATQDPIPLKSLIAFSSEGRDAIASCLVEKVDLFRYNTEIIKGSPGSGTKNIYTLHYIAVLVGCAIKGLADAELLEYDTIDKVEKTSLELSNKLNEFFLYCPSTALLLQKQKIEVADVAHFRSTSILALSIGLEILGHLLNRCIATPKQLATQVDWSRNSDWWKDLIILNDNDLDQIRVKAVGAEAALKIAESAIARIQVDQI